MDYIDIKLQFLTESRYILSRLMVVCFLFFLSSYSFSRSEIIPSMTDSELIEEASDIVEGVVVDVAVVPAMLFSDPCFDYVYRFRIDKSLKGGHLSGDYIDVGSANSFGKVKINERQLLVLRPAAQSTYENCSLGRLEKSYKKLKIKMPISVAPGVFNLQRNDRGEVEFRAINCNGGRIMFLDYFKSIGREHSKTEIYDGVSCTILEGLYKDLSRAIQESMGN